MEANYSVGSEAIYTIKTACNRGETSFHLCPQVAERCQLNHSNYSTTIIPKMALYFRIINNTIRHRTEALHLLSHFLTFDYCLLHTAAY